MRERFSGLMITAALAAAAAVISTPIIRTQAQAPAASGTTPEPVQALKTPWANLTCRAFGPTNLIRPCSVLPSMRARNFSPGHSGKN